MTVVIGTAGHIDHGKTALLRALTGIDADRLPEERRRGMTIDVGYAHLRLPDGTDLDLVDVPGHDRLVGNMLVGAGEIDAALLVVAADDGVRAQTLEHLELLDGLGIDLGLAVVTKTDLVDADRLARVTQQVIDLLGRSTLGGSPVLAVSSATGAGLDALRTALSELRDRVARARQARDPDRRIPPRLAVDRAFTVKGRGLVVTGSLRGGPLATGDTLRGEPGGGSVRVRELQVHGAAVDAVADGGRVALNVAGVAQGSLVRGTVLTNDPDIRSTDRLLVVLRPPAQLDDRAPSGRWPLPAGSTYRLHLATESVDARVQRGRGLGAGLADGRQIATLRLAVPIAAAPGNRFVVRVPSPGRTAAGGIVLDSAPPVGPSRRRASAGRLVALAMVRESDAAAARLELHGVIARPAGRVGAMGRPEVAADLDAALHDEAVALPGASGMPLAEARRALVRSLRRQATVDEATAAAIIGRLLDELTTGGRLARAGDALYLPGYAPAGLPAELLTAMDRLEQALSVPAPPPLAEAARVARCAPDGVRALEAAERIVRVGDDLAWAAGTYRELESAALRLATGEPLTPAALRDATGTSRKYVMALLEDLDRRGVLRRTPAGHVPGPRAPTVR
ncbi:MAG TPA: selenocysteine-specific translation elongation factor [Candidatus Baltobacteraceae bacterium]|nr:selenocysteine-specific translation elongation factor [Candidatus Baltobacteraceae bacterium]